MIQNNFPPPRLDPERIDRMIGHALSHPQEVKKSLRFPAALHSPARIGIGASLMAASIAGILWLGSATPLHPLPPLTEGVEISDLMLYDMLEDLS